MRNRVAATSYIAFCRLRTVGYRLHSLGVAKKHFSPATNVPHNTLENRLNLDPNMNALSSLVDCVARLRGTNADVQPIDVEISQLIANDLMALNAEDWRVGSNGFMQDDSIDRLLSQIRSSGSSSLNGLIVRGGIRISIATDPRFTGIRII